MRDGTVSERQCTRITNTTAALICCIIRDRTIVDDERIIITDTPTIIFGRATKSRTLVARDRTLVEDERTIISDTPTTIGGCVARNRDVREGEQAIIDNYTEPLLLLVGPFEC